MNQAQATPNKTEATYPRYDGVLLEPSPRWVRVKFNDTFVADSKRVLLFREPSRTPLYFFPEEDVRMDLLELDREAQSGKVYWNVRVGDRVAEAGAWGYADPPADRAGLAGYVTFKWHEMDHWYEEEEEIFVHPRDPYKRVDILSSSRHVQVVVDEVTVADTHRPTLLFETGLPTRYYIPQEDVRMELLERSRGKTECPYKGTATYWSVKLGDKTVRNIVWDYLDPIHAAEQIKGLLSFFNEKVDIYVDGEPEDRPRTPWSP